MFRVIHLVVLLSLSSQLTRAIDVTDGREGTLTQCAKKSPAAIGISALQRSFEGLEGKPAVIYFTDALKSTDSIENTWDPGSNSKKERHIMRRPVWQKSLRCQNESSESCEECYTSDTCWTIKSYSESNRLDRAVEVTPNSSWHRFVNLIHVSCKAKKVLLRYDVFDIKDGTLRALWDGKEINKENYKILKDGNQIAKTLSPFTWSGGDFRTKMPAANTKVYARIQLSHRGGHEFRLEFTPNRDRPGSAMAAIRSIRFWMPHNFVVCEDTKVCLDALVGLAGLKLRSVNSLQRQCLEGPMPANLANSSEDEEACRKWRECLANTTGNENHSQHILALLNAASIGSSPLQSEPNSSSDALAGSDRECIHPELDDPESWDCDCFAEMHQTCERVEQRVLEEAVAYNYSLELCLRALMCQHARVCTEWKRYACESPDIQPILDIQTGRGNTSDVGLIEDTTNMDLALRQQSRHMHDQQTFYTQRDAREARDFDQTLASKHCN